MLNIAEMVGSWTSRTTSSIEGWNACNCVGPQPGEKHCPCVKWAKMREEREIAARAVNDFINSVMSGHKPRIRVKAGRRKV